MPSLNPTSIAVIGASETPGKVGHEILKNLLTQGYGGKVYPVNPKREEILGAKAYPSISAISDPVDMAVIVIPAAHVNGALEECGKKGVKDVVVISAGFGEVHTEEGRALERQLMETARNFDISLIGPNCLGVVRPHIKMNASFAKDLPPAGGIALISQSGAMGVALMDSAISSGMGMSAFISIGNKAVMDECDLLEACAKDPDTTVIGFYLESIRDGRRFLEIARHIVPTKPIVLLKAGVSAHGAKAAASHTGALAGSDAAIDALCEQSGIRRSETTEEFLDLLTVLSHSPTLLSRDIAIVTNAGGPGILATDASERAKLNLPALDAARGEELKKVLPPAASISNPIDVLGDAGADRYKAAIETCIKDPRIDGLCVVLTPQVMTPVTDIAKVIIELARETPLLPVVTAFMGGESVHEARKLLRDAGIPCFATPERAVHALATLLPHPPVPKTDAAPGINVARQKAAHAIFKNKKDVLGEEDVQALFKLYDLPLPQSAIAHSPEEAAEIATRIGYPVIAKISSPDILHKTDAGGVRMNLKTAEDAARAYTDIRAAIKQKVPNARIDGVQIQQFLPVGKEFIVGGLQDPSFGPLVMAGLGGIYTELLKDATFRISPVTEREAYEMLSSLRSWKLMLGMRGEAQLDIDALARILVRASMLLHECPMIKELDLNPVLLSKDGAIIVDAKVVL